MDLSQFPERFRGHVLSCIVRNNRKGISIRFGKLEGEVLPLSVRQDFPQPEVLLPNELENVARMAFSQLPYDLIIKVGE
jgi:hypothetical protein